LPPPVHGVYALETGTPVELHSGELPISQPYRIINQP